MVNIFFYTPENAESDRSRPIISYAPSSDDDDSDVLSERNDPSFVATKETDEASDSDKSFRNSSGLKKRVKLETDGTYKH